MAEYITNPVECPPAGSTDGSALGVMGCYTVKQMTRQEAISGETMVMTVLAVAQMVIYWKMFDDVLEKRDNSIDKLLGFMDELQGYKAVDKVILDAKKNALSMPLPSVNPCSASTIYGSESLKDGAVIDKVSQDAANCSCKGVPDGWGLHEGQLLGSLAAVNSGSYIVGNAKRRRENQRVRKTQIVLSAQQGMKSVYRASDIISYYQQAVGIYQGLSDIFISGFNSAGAALGTALGRMSGGTSSSYINIEGPSKTNFNSNSGTGATVDGFRGR